MRRLYRILLGCFIAFMVLLILYALPWTRPHIENILGPPLGFVFGGMYHALANFGPIVWLFANPLALLIIGIFVGICPVSFPIIHRSFNRVRGKFMRSGMKESGMYPTMTEPVSSVSTYRAEATPTSTTKEEPKPEPSAEPAKEEPAT